MLREDAKKIQLKKIFSTGLTPMRKKITTDAGPRTDPVSYRTLFYFIVRLMFWEKKLQDARLEQERTMLSRQIEATEGAIDKLVYELYGLTEEEIVIVEGSGK